MKPEDIIKLIDERVTAAIREQFKDTFDIYGEVPRAGLVFPLDDDTIKSLKTGGFMLLGTATLASGVATVTDSRIRATGGSGVSFTGSVAFASYKAPGGTTGTNLKVVCTENTLTITAVGTGGATVTTDTSEVQFLLIF